MSGYLCHVCKQPIDNVTQAWRVNDAGYEVHLHCGSCQHEWETVQQTEPVVRMALVCRKCGRAR